MPENVNFQVLLLYCYYYYFRLLVACYWQTKSKIVHDYLLFNGSHIVTQKLETGAKKCFLNGVLFHFNHQFHIPMLSEVDMAFIRNYSFSTKNWILTDSVLCLVRKRKWFYNSLNGHVIVYAAIRIPLFKSDLQSKIRVFSNSLGKTKRNNNTILRIVFDYNCLGQTM